MTRTFLALLAFTVCLFTGGGLWAQTIDGTVLVEPELVADVTSITPGKPFTAGLYLKTAPGWHTYWANPGDSGLPVSIDWQLPEGWKAGPIQWPIPDKHLEPGDLITFGYEGEVMLLVEITPPAGLTGADATLKARASWLVCRESCVPGQAELDLTLPVGGEPSPARSELFAKFRARLPQAGPPPFRLKWEPHDTEVYLKIEGLEPGPKLDFFSLAPIQKHPELLNPRTLRIPFPPAPEPPVARGLLVVEQPDGMRQGWYVENTPSGSQAAAALPPPATPPAVGGGLTLPKALGLGFVGGFILNLMPCVLPVIALKIFGFLGQAGESRQRVFKVGLAFVAGIFAWFLGLAALIVAARMAGREITWAFQFQNPVFVLGMMLVVFVFALNLLGVFELWLPGTGKLVTLSEKEGYGGAFLHGAFATLLATPCTAPFLGPALAFAFAQTPAVTFAMFGAVAAGMSAPYLVLTAQPGWMRFLPKPGNWMVRFKQVMGFLLLGTVVWLLGVIGSLDKSGGMAGATWLLLGVGMACWIFGAWVTPGARKLQQAVALIAMAAVIATGAMLGKPGMETTGWEAWSPERVAQLRREGRPIFVDFTADWCINCKVNERFVLHTGPVETGLRGFAKLRADWTTGDPVITAALKSLGRAGVPVYAVYPEGGGEPEVLPELLTQAIVLEALQKANP